MPMYEGGDSVSKYSIQWDTNSNFGPTAQTAIFSNLTSGSPYSYVIRGLTTNTNYYIRVLSYNSYGYGPPAHAFVPNDHREIQVITLTASSFIQQGQFRLSYTPSNVYGSLRTQYTDVLNHDADAATMAEAINSLKGIQSVQVTRRDMGAIYDTSGVDTAQSSMAWSVTFVNPSGDVANLTPVYTNADATRKEKQLIRFWSAVDNVALSGQYKLRNEFGEETACIDIDSNKTHLENLLESLGSFDDVNVTKSVITKPGVGHLMKLNLLAIKFRETLASWIF